MKHFADWDDRTLDLCVERFTVGLDQEDEAVLNRLADPDDVDEFERVVAAVHLGLMTELEPPPTALLERLEREGRQSVVAHGAPSGPPAGRIVPFPSRVIAVTGWLVAAVLLFMLFPFGASKTDVLVRRDTLIADAGDLVRASWTATEDAAAVGASGDVVWSSARQEGYMRLVGLAPNDPDQNQYQLWIFDPTRADWEAKPVDGGVFDVANTREVVVPIDAKLAVDQTALFAITVEVPGGVVVSERERLVLTASP